MTLLQITSVKTTHEHNIVSKFFNLDSREHFTIKALATDIEHEGEYKDKNGVVWSVAFEEDFNLMKSVVITSVKPLYKLKIETEYN